MKRNEIKRTVFILILCLFSTTLLAQAPSPLSVTAEVPKAGAYVNDALTYKIIDALNHSFGYDIYAEGKLMIHQPSIPAMPGNVGFTTKENAEKVAKLVIGKLQKGEIPPTVSIDEMKKLSILK